MLLLNSDPAVAGVGGGKKRPSSRSRTSFHQKESTIICLRRISGLIETKK